MRTREFRIIVFECDKVSDLPESDQELIYAARKASKNSYAPYSGFCVGAAAKLENGHIVTGSNQENADFTDGMCAERVALYYANSKYPDSGIEAVAVSARNKNGLIDGPAQPCGSCRQALLELEHRFKTNIRLIMDGKKGIRVFEGAESLLPFAFKPDVLD